MPEKRVAAVVGIDTGGTFTDIVAVVGGEVRVHKVLSTPANPALAVLRGLRELLPDGCPERLTYATTVATNAVLERKGARVALLTTAGFEDVIEIGRQNRPDLYALEPRRPEPLVPRARRVGVDERMLYDGSVSTPLGETELARALRVVTRLRPEAVAVCFLHSYANPLHERLAGRALAAAGAEFTSLSHEVVGEYREYERFSSTVVNAYVGPVMSRHLRTLGEGLPRVPWRVMQSNGGAIGAAQASREAVRTVLSGPAAGVIGAWNVARRLGLRRVMTFDMGGTSTDVSLIDGTPRQATEWEIGGFPLNVPAIDIHTVGAGGGSAARVDDGGALKVGPESAGADPGPACYGKGSLPTVTDANLVLGRLAPEAFLGGRMRLDADRARESLARLGEELGLTPEEAAEGVARVVNAGMERAVRRVSVERGHDPRDYALIAFGGAAGQHACELGEMLGIRRVLVPGHPGLLSALGAASADVHRDQVRTVRLVDPPLPRLQKLFAPLERAGTAALRAEGVPPSGRQLIRSADVRYAGQSHEIRLPFGPRLLADFHAAHARLYGYAAAERPVEVVNLRLLAVGRFASPRRQRAHTAAGGLPSPQHMRWHGRWLRGRVYRREQLNVLRPVRGPALVVEFSATTFVPPGWVARLLGGGDLEVRRGR